MTSEKLDPGGNPVRVGAVKLSTQGLRGRVELVDAGADAVRAESASTRLDEALAQRGFQEQHAPVVLTEVESVAPVVDEDAGTRGETTSAKLITPAPAEGWGQLLVTEQGDLVTLEFPDEAATGAIVDRGGGELTYTIDLPVPPAPESERAERGIVGKIVKKIVKVLAFRVAAEVGEGLVSRWEVDARKHRLRELSSTTIKDPTAAAVDESKWRELAAGPTLLLIHGTNSQLHTGFHALPDRELETFRERYGNRVIGFDHPTLTLSPAANIDNFMDLLPRGIELDLDIVCHSRGGLVARELSQRPRSGSRVNVSNIVFVATPNGGTALADSDHLKEFINSYTNFLNFMPDNVFTTILDAVVTLAKEVAVGIHSRLDGLQSMDPNGAYLKELNAAGHTSTTHSAIATNFEPPGMKDFALWARDQLLDKVFGSGVENDLVVPTKGCFEIDGAAGGFPIQNRLLYAPTDAVHHSSFFGDSRALQFLHTNLTGRR
ncbi:MAG: esterase/lipase family protein [Actinomycetota bacterium]